MAAHWAEVQSVFQSLSYIVKSCNRQGIRLFFTTSDDSYRSNRITKLGKFLNSNIPKREADMDRKLNDILGPYLNKLCHCRQSAWRGLISWVQPLSLYIFTDGRWEIRSDGISPIKRTAEVLEKWKFPYHQIGIQFIRFGNDQSGIRRLDHLNSNLELARFGFPQ